MGRGLVVDRIMAVTEDEKDGKVDKKREKRFPPNRGEIGELEFMQKAIRKGFWGVEAMGDSDRCDAVTDWNGTLLRVQVRATERPAEC